ncbi:MAG: hypothetical protein Q7U73_17775 [Rubrivivax sp.]|nr:hypothetical protein [Rubrivivax sp.]
MHSRSIVLAALLTLANAAWGQAAKAEAAESEAAMERAKRAAAGPLKAIQQAAKINRRRGEPEALPAPAAAVISVSSSAVAPPTAPAAVPVAVPVAVPARAIERADPPPVDVVLEFGNRVPAVAEAAEAAPIAPIPPAALPQAVAAALPSTGVVAHRLLDTLPVQPKVLSMVEPNIPARLFDQGLRVAEVEAELSLRADGTVAEARLLSSAPRTWHRYITTALEQWRFEPLGSPRTHRVLLVFGAAER